MILNDISTKSEKCFRKKTRESSFIDFPKIPKGETSHQFACSIESQEHCTVVFLLLFLWSFQDYRGPKFLNKVSYPEERLYIRLM